MSPPNRCPPTRTDPRQVRGLRGEHIARGWLETRGYTVEAHRFRLGHQEIDLIVRKRDLVAFVEVKTRRSLAFGLPGEAVHWKKRRSIGRVAAAWMLRYGRRDDTYRFDVFEVYDVPGQKPKVRHIEDAWRL